MDSDLPRGRPRMRAGLGALVAVTGLASCSAPADPPAPQRVPAPAQTTAAAASTARVTLVGNTHPLALPQYDLGPVERDLALAHMQLVLKRDPAVAGRLAAHIDALHDPRSPRYHQWLTAADFGDQYGPSPADVDAVTTWLASAGLHVDGVPASRMFVEFSGAAGDVEAAFGAPIHRLNVDGELHFANVADPTIPASLANVVEGVHALHDFMPHPLHQRGRPVRREAGRWSYVGGQSALTGDDATNGPFYAVGPADFATIYGLGSLFSEGIRGAGQTVAVVEDTDLLDTADVTTFRSAFGLSGYAGTFSQISPQGGTVCANPGVTADEGEAALDAEWAGATAPDAAVVLAACSNTTTVFGGLIAIENLINGANPPSILSVSYDECESANGSAANAAYVNAYQQAVAEGISVFVAAGDQGGAGCDGSRTYATHGLAVSAFASTPYDVAVGGTDFMDTYDHANGGPSLATYWSASNSATYGSALSYVPEIPWNDSCAGELALTLSGYTVGYGSSGFCNATSASKGGFLTTTAGGGGTSAYSSQPSWQTGVVGLPTASAGARYLPDVSLFAGNGTWSHFLLYCMTDTAEQGGPCVYTNDADVEALGSGGTSYAAPAMAGIQALVNQSTGSAQGNPNYRLYALAAAQQSARGSACNSTGGTVTSPVLPSASCIFNDVTQGDTDLPCRTTNGCYGAGTGSQGVLSTSTSTLTPAYAATTGWDYATGLGSVNAYNLVHAWGSVDAGTPPPVDAGRDASSDASVADAHAETGGGAGPDAASDGSAPHEGGPSTVGGSSGGADAAQAGDADEASEVGQASEDGAADDATASSSGGDGASVVPADDAASEADPASADASEGARASGASGCGCRESGASRESSSAAWLGLFGLGMVASRRAGRARRPSRGARAELGNVRRVPVAPA